MYFSVFSSMQVVVKIALEVVKQTEWWLGLTTSDIAVLAQPCKYVFIMKMQSSIA